MTWQNRPCRKKTLQSALSHTYNPRCMHSRLLLFKNAMQPSMRSVFVLDVNSWVFRCREEEPVEENFHSEPDSELEWEERMRYEQGLDGDPDSIWGRYGPQPSKETPYHILLQLHPTAGPAATQRVQVCFGCWWCSHYGPFGAAAPGQAESEDAYARRLWEEMERRKRASSGASAAARQTWGAADEAAARRTVPEMFPPPCQSFAGVQLHCARTHPSHASAHFPHVRSNLCTGECEGR